MDFTSQLLKWYNANRRDLPWKNTRNPYKIWLSEIILQQTRVEQGTPYYHRFVEKYPSVQSLAAANIDEVLRLWQGLGYYSRARNLYYTAQQIVNEFDGIFPNNYQKLMSLKGVGSYTAAAIASFAFKEPVPAIDGNAYRTLSRVFGIETPIDSVTGKKQFFELATELISQKYPDKFNQALMDFGSLICTPTKPLCAECPIQEICYAFRHRAISDFPTKSKRLTIRNRYFYYLFIRQNKFTYIRKRTEKDIWQGLYEFPMIETQKRISEKQLFADNRWTQITASTSPTITKIKSEIKHQLTHQTLHATFYVVDIQKPSDLLAQDYLKIAFDKLDNYSLPRLLTIFLDKL